MDSCIQFGVLVSDAYGALTGPILADTVWPVAPLFGPATSPCPINSPAPGPGSSNQSQD